MNHFVNTVILLLFYRYIGLWYKKRPRPLGRAPSPSGQDVRFCARPFFLLGVSFRKLHFLSAVIPPNFVRAHFFLSLRDRKDNGRLTRFVVSDPRVYLIQMP